MCGANADYYQNVLLRLRCRNPTGRAWLRYLTRAPKTTSRRTSMSSQPMTIQTPKRLPRYRRAERQVNVMLTQRDLDILHIVQSHRLANSQHLQALVDGSDQGILRRLQLLYHAGYLDRLIPQRMYGEGSQKMTYAITN